MAKKSMLERETKKGLLVEKYRTRRAELKTTIKSSTDFDVIMATQGKLAVQRLAWLASMAAG